jgi:hypothetical protein
MPVLGPGYMARNVDGIDANIERYGGEGRHWRWVWVLCLSKGQTVSCVCL